MRPGDWRIHWFFKCIHPHEAECFAHAIKVSTVLQNDDFITTLNASAALNLSGMVQQVSSVAHSDGSHHAQPMTCESSLCSLAEVRETGFFMFDREGESKEKHIQQLNKDFLRKDRDQMQAPSHHHIANEQDRVRPPAPP